MTVQPASDQLLNRLEDLREQVSALKVRVAGIDGVGSAESSPIAAGVRKLHRILWVDDYPENNACEVEALQRKGVGVQLARSTAEALREVASADPPYDCIITDMGRRENGDEHPQAGLELIAQLKEQNVASPVYVYASAPAISRARRRLEAEGVPATASATELMELLGRLGLE